MKYKVDKKQLTIDVYTRLTTDEIALILNELVREEREQNFVNHKWEIRREEKEIPTNPFG